MRRVEEKRALMIQLSPNDGLGKEWQERGGGEAKWEEAKR